MSGPGVGAGAGARRQPKPKKPVGNLRARKAGLNFPVGRIHRLLRNG